MEKTQSSKNQIEFKCLTCKWEPIWSEWKTVISELNPEKFTRDGICRYPLPAPIKRKMGYIVQRDDQFAPVKQCDCWEPVTTKTED